MEYIFLLTKGHKRTPEDEVHLKKLQYKIKVQW